MILGSAQFREAVRYELNLIEAALMKPGALEDPEGRRQAERLQRALQSYFQTLAYDVDQIEWKDLFAKFEQAADIDGLVKKYRDPKTGKLTPDAFQAARLEAMERIKPHVAAHNQALHKVITDNIAQSYQGGNKNTWKAMPNVGPNDQLPPGAKLKRIGDTVGLKQRALDWAKEHAGKLVTSIDETTREQIAKIVAENISDGKGLGVARDRIMKELSVDMPESRALMIARTESCGAWNRGTLDGLKAKGMKWKKIVTHDPCPICIYIKRAGPVPIDQPFPRPSKRGGKRSKMTDDQHPPFHPRCYCSLVGAFPPKGVAEPVPTPDADGVPVPAPAPKPVTPQIPAPTPVAPIIAPTVVPTPVPAPTAPVAPTKPWTNQATIAEAETHAKELFPHMEFEFTDAHIDAINPTMGEFTKLSKEFPLVLKDLQYIGTQTSAGIHPYSFGVNTWAHAYLDGSAIGLNPRYYGDSVAFGKAVEEHETRDKNDEYFHPLGGGTIESVMAHEFGHTLEFATKKYYGNLLGVEWADGWGRFDRIFEAVLDAHHPDGKTLSRYGEHRLGNNSETFAESFLAMYHTPEKNKSKYVKKFKSMVGLIKKAIAGQVDQNQIAEFRDLSTDDKAKWIDIRENIEKELGIKP